MKTGYLFYCIGLILGFAAGLNDSVVGQIIFLIGGLVVSLAPDIHA